MPTLIRCAKNVRQGDQVQTARAASQNSKLTQNLTESWVLVYDGYVDTLTVASAASTTVGLAAGFPFAGGIFNGLFCISVNPVRDRDSPNVWSAQVQYQTILQPDESVTGNWNIKLRRGSVAREETATRDGIGKPLWNAADMFLPQLPNDTIYDELLTISYSTKLLPSWSDANEEGKVNDGNVTFTVCGIRRTFTPRQMRCTAQNIDCDRVVIGKDGLGRPINRITYNCELSFQIRKPDWTWVAPNEGYIGIDPTTGKKAHFTTDPTDRYNHEKTPSTEPLKMDATGAALEDDTILWIPEDLTGDARYSDDGRFVIPKSTPMASLFVGLNDDEQLPPPTT